MNKHHLAGQLQRRTLITGLCAVAAAGVGVSAFGPAAQAQKLEKADLKMTLEWAFQGPQSVFTSAQDNGFFKKEGLKVQVDRGNGSTDAVVRVASGTYDFGWSEMSSIVKYNAENPNNPLVAVYVTHENSANAVMSIKGRGIQKPKDLEGKKVGSTAGSAARDIFDAFANANGVDPSKIKTQTVSGSLREAMLVRGDVDAILGAVTSGALTVKSLKVKMDDIVIMTYGDYGVPLYGHAVFTTAAFAAAHPNTIAAIVRAVNNALKSAIASPKEAVATLTSRDKLVDLALEQERLELMLKRLVLTDNIRAHGLSSVTPERLNATIKIICDAYGVKTRPSPDKIFDARYLPPQAERMPPVLKD
jgi:NitT/TauT family transport system substrate-binding protein